MSFPFKYASINPSKSPSKTAIRHYDKLQNKYGRENLVLIINRNHAISSRMGVTHQILKKHLHSAIKSQFLNSKILYINNRGNFRGKYSIMVNISEMIKSSGIKKWINGKLRYVENPISVIRKDIGTVTDSFSSCAPSCECVLSENLLARTSPEQQTVLKRLYSEFLKLKSHTGFRPTNNLISKGSLLHGTNYEAKSFEEIIKGGLVSPDIAATKSGLRMAHGEQRTYGGIDTWVVDERRSVDEYFNEYLATPPEYANTPSKRHGRWFCWRGENKWIDIGRGGSKQKNIVFVINPVKDTELQTITSYGVTPATCNSPETLFGGKMTEDMYQTENFVRHTFIPVGIPSNYFEKIIVGDQVTKTQIKEMQKILAKYKLKTRLYNTKGELLLSFDDLIKYFNFSSFEKRGLPLEYPRAAFVSDIKKAIGHLPKEEQERILAKFNMKYSRRDIEGFPSCSGISGTLTKPEEIKVAQLINKFNTNNSITIDNNPKMQEELNSILDEMPEFRMILGKQQHGTHYYSVDIHTLEVLKKAMSHEAAASLSAESQEVMRLSVLMHDFGKCGGVVTPGHAKDSCKYAEQVLKHYNLSDTTKARILNIIENHHWFEQYNKGYLTKRDFYRIFPTEEDRIIAKIFAKADFESVNQTFHLGRLKEDTMLSVEEYEKLFKQKMEALD